MARRWPGWKDFGPAICCSPSATRLILFTALCGIALISVSGCGDGRPERVAVSGQVLIDGKPLTHGFISMVPKGARPASGTIGPDGRFIMTTFECGDGTVLGTHAVSVMAGETLSETATRWHAPKKYADPNTSGLVETVDGPTDSLVIKLTWGGGKPFIERDGDAT
ncbi:MAG: hypothetical protein JW719_06300 [Pirellulales bacterium]|nr:hypothetical protein [Pirellulales bacterium]